MVALLASPQARLDHRPGDQHQRRLQHGVRRTQDAAHRSDRSYSRIAAPACSGARRQMRFSRCTRRRHLRRALRAHRQARRRISPTHGIAPDDTVAIMLPNSVPWVESCFAITRAGAVSVPISYDSTEAEIAYRLIDATARRSSPPPSAATCSPSCKPRRRTPDLLIVTDRGGCRAHGAALRRSDRRAAAVDAARSALPSRDRLHSLHLGHHRPRQGRSAHRARHAVDRGRLLGADHRPVRHRTRCCRRCRCFIPTRSIFRCSAFWRPAPANTSWRNSPPAKRCGC